MTTEELKVRAYDLLVLRQQVDTELSQVNAEISKNEETKQQEVRKETNNTPASQEIGN